MSADTRFKSAAAWLLQINYFGMVFAIMLRDSRPRRTAAICALASPALITQCELDVGPPGAGRRLRTVCVPA